MKKSSAVTRGNLSRALRGVFGWLPCFLGLGGWVITAVYPELQNPSIFVLGLTSSILLSVTLHEAGHFLAARVLGLNPWWVTIGYGNVVFERQFETFRLTLREFPYAGQVYPFVTTTELHRVRWRMLAMVLAGPASNGLLLVCSGIVALNSVSSPSNFSSISWEMSMANLYLLLISSVPARFKLDGRQVSNDALLMVKLLFATSDHERPGQREELAMSERPSWLWLVKHVKPDTLLATYRNQLSKDNLPADERALILDGYATCVLMYGAADSLAEADRYSEELLRLKPTEWTVKGTRGSILVEKGEVEAGMALLLEVMRHDPSTFDRAIAASFLALGELKMQHLTAADKWLHIARELDPCCASARRIQQLRDQHS